MRIFVSKGYDVIDNREIIKSRSISKAIIYVKVSIEDEVIKEYRII